MKTLTTFWTLLLLVTVPLFGQQDHLTDLYSIKIVCAEPLGQAFYIIKGDNKQTELFDIPKETAESTLTSINPKWIKSIDIYKGQKAIDLYGDKGKNGVIIVQLKRGRLEKLPKDIKDRFKEI